MDIAQKKLDEVIARRVKIAELLIPARAAVEADKEATKGIRGAPTLPRKNKTAALKAAVARLGVDVDDVEAVGRLPQRSRRVVE